MKKEMMYNTNGKMAAMFITTILPISTSLWDGKTPV